MNYEDLYIRDFFTGLRAPNYKKISELSDEEFAGYYLNIMQSYDCWENNKRPKCSECQEQIKRPEDLRRLYGVCLCPECVGKVFWKTYAEDYKKMGKYEKLYWPRVIALKL